MLRRRFTEELRNLRARFLNCLKADGEEEGKAMLLAAKDLGGATLREGVINGFVWVGDNGVERAQEYFKNADTSLDFELKEFANRSWFDECRLILSPVGNPLRFEKIKSVEGVSIGVSKEPWKVGAQASADFCFHLARTVEDRQTWYEYKAEAKLRTELFPGDFREAINTTADRFCDLILYDNFQDFKRYVRFIAEFFAYFNLAKRLADQTTAAVKVGFPPRRILLFFSSIQEVLEAGVMCDLDWGRGTVPNKEACEEFSTSFKTHLENEGLPYKSNAAIALAEEVTDSYSNLNIGAHPKIQEAVSYSTPSEYARLFEFAKANWSRGTDKYILAELLKDGVADYWELSAKLLPSENNKTHRNRRFTAVAAAANEEIERSAEKPIFHIVRNSRNTVSVLPGPKPPRHKNPTVKKVRRKSKRDKSG